MTSSPTASKVASNGAKKPNAIPPTKLPRILTIGHNTSGNGKEISVTILRIIPNFFVLVIKNQMKQSSKGYEIKTVQSGMKIILHTFLHSSMSRRNEQARDRL